MRDFSNSRTGFDRVLMAVAATFLTVSAGASFAQGDSVRNSAAELAIDAAIPRPEPVTVRPVSVEDFKPETTASVPNAAMPAEKAAETAPADVAKPAITQAIATPANLMPAPAAEISKTDAPANTAVTTPPETAATAPPPVEPVKAASTVPAEDSVIFHRKRRRSS